MASRIAASFSMSRTLVPNRPYPRGRSGSAGAAEGSCVRLPRAEPPHGSRAAADLVNKIDTVAKRLDHTPHDGQAKPQTTREEIDIHRI